MMDRTCPDTKESATFKPTLFTKNDGAIEVTQAYPTKFYLARHFF
jgi:hypothetical protein